MIPGQWFLYGGGFGVKTEPTGLNGAGQNEAQHASLRVSRDLRGEQCARADCV